MGRIGRNGRKSLFYSLDGAWHATLVRLIRYLSSNRQWHSICFLIRGIDMKEIAKSMFSYSLATALFGLKQFDNMFSRSGGGTAPVGKALDGVTCATVAQLGETLTDTFQAADHLQRGLVELMFDLFRAKLERAPAIVAVPVAEPQRWTEAMEPFAPAGRVA